MGGKKSRCFQISKNWRQKFLLFFICPTLSGQLCPSRKLGYSLIQPLSVTVTNLLLFLRTRNNIKKSLLACSSLHSPFYIPFFDMGVTKKQGGKESEGNTWLVAGISVRVPLKSTSAKPKEGHEDYKEGCTTPPAREFKMPEMFTCPAAPRKRRPSLNCEDYDKCVVTPPAREFKIPETFTSPAAPRKRRPSLNCHFYGVGFSNSPDLESVCLYSPC